MATATVLAPSAHYPTQTSYSSGYPQHPPPAAANSSNMMTTEPRRSSDDNESTGRQSLPSISEVISGARPGQYPPAHAGLQSGPGLPSPFTQANHQYPEADKRSSPQPVHPASGFPQRPEPLPALTDSPRPPFTGRHSLPPVSDRRPTPPAKSEIAHQHAAKPSDSHPQNGAYAHPPPPPPPAPTSHPTSHPYQPGQLPPGQVPLPNYPISPRHGVPIAPGHYDPRGQPVHPDDADFANRARYDPSLSRHFETWNYQDSLSRVRAVTFTVYGLAAYLRATDWVLLPHHLQFRRSIYPNRTGATWVATHPPTIADGSRSLGDACKCRLDQALSRTGQGRGAGVHSKRAGPRRDQGQGHVRRGPRHSHVRGRHETPICHAARGQEETRRESPFPGSHLQP